MNLMIDHYGIIFTKYWIEWGGLCVIIQASVWADLFSTTLFVWQLDYDSELLFVGDAGTTEASRPSRRQGIELTHYY